MAITRVKIHPAIGIARVGDSPTEFFYGPEKPNQLPLPDGSFKDDNCRIKRQAARFRIFAYHSDGSTSEITSADATIQWTVHVANTKVDPSGLSPRIDSGKQTISSSKPNKRTQLSAIWKLGSFSETVKLGEAWCDAQGRLIFLGGAGAAGHPPQATVPPNGWHDDVCDGPITAKVTLNNGDSFTAEHGAWVVSAPPKFAPHLNSIVTLYDYFYDFAAGQGWVVPAAKASYTEHIYPILQRAKDVYWVTGIKAHNSWSHPLPADVGIFNRLRPPNAAAHPGQDMPQLKGPLTLTATQYEWMRQWSLGNAMADWQAPPEPALDITPEGLDRAALEACVGGAFNPGIEVGGVDLQSLKPDLFVGAADPLRIRGGQAPGILTAGLNVLWQTDMFNCVDYWPIARPSIVFPEGGGSQEDWTALDGIEFVTDWASSRFIVKQDDQYFAKECEPPSPPFSPHLAQIYAQIIFGITRDGGGVDSIHGRVPPRVDRGQRDAIRAIALSVLATEVENPQVRASLQEHALRSAGVAINDAIAGLRDGKRST